MLGELEDALERARGDALVEHLALLLVGLGLLLALDGQRILLRLERDVVLGKARDCDRDAVGVLAGPLDVVGRIGRARDGDRPLVEDREELVESDGGTIEGSKIERTHGISSWSDMRRVRRDGRSLWVARTGWLRALSSWERKGGLARGSRGDFVGTGQGRFVPDNSK